MVTYNDVDYFYVYNLQGDVVALIDANDTQGVECVYDVWGTPISKTGTMAATLGTVNPFCYRGYAYDGETGDSPVLHMAGVYRIEKGKPVFSILTREPAESMSSGKAYQNLSELIFANLPSL